MKTRILQLFFALAFIVCAMSAHAAIPVPAVAPPVLTNSYFAMERAVQHQINRYMIFPLAVEEDAMFGTVEVQFVVNTEGRLVVTAAHSENQALCDYVVKKLQRVQVGANPSGLWKISHMRFTFRPE